MPTAASAVATFTVVQGFFWHLEKIQSRANRQFVGRWLMRLTPPDAKWTGIVIELFHRLFGERHWTLRCFAMSSLMTTLTVSLIVLAFNTVQGWTWDTGAFALWWRVTLGYIILACVTDYFSLWVTRKILHSTAKSSGWIGVIGFVALDLAATTLLFEMEILLWFFIFSPIFEPLSHESLGEFMAGLLPSLVVLAHATFVERNLFIDTFYFASLITSAWLWGYLLVAQSIRSLNYMPACVRALSKVIDIKEHPVRSIGTVVALICAGFTGLLNLL